MYEQYRDTAVEAALEAGRIQRSFYESAFSVDYKGERDLVTEVDRAAEDAIISLVSSRFPDHDFVAEEGDYGCKSSAWRWIIDPLDGTTNFAHGFPWFCVSIALEENGTLVAGAVYNPLFGEMFTATLGGGAYLNGRRIRVSRRKPLSSALLATGFPYDRATDPANNFDNFIRFQTTARAVRRAGAAALDLAYVAAGRLDGFWELKLKPWDVAAGCLLITEAGGMVTTFDGSEYSVRNDRILASNGLIHDEMEAILSRTHDREIP